MNLSDGLNAVFKVLRYWLDSFRTQRFRFQLGFESCTDEIKSSYLSIQYLWSQLTLRKLVRECLRNVSLQICEKLWEAHNMRQ